MLRTWHIALAALLLGSLCLAVPTARAATYKGHNVDGKRFTGSVVNADYGKYDNVEVKFQSQNAYVYFGGGGRLVLILDDEEIVNPHEIYGYDHLRGITWEIDLADMVVR